MRKIPEHCERCGVKMTVSKMSRFNTETLCVDCENEEKEAPGYQHAWQTELNEVRKGNWNFAGVGLDPLSLGFVCGRMDLRGIDRAIIAAYSKKHGYPYKEEGTA